MDKEQLAKYLSELDENVLRVAIMYATNYLKYGVDVAEKWETATRQQDALYRAKCAGYYEGRSSIVRCKDCKYGLPLTDSAYIQCSCAFHTSERHGNNWFCADGRRRDETD